MFCSNSAIGSNASYEVDPGNLSFNKVSLLLKSNGLNGGQNQTFIDSSDNNLTLTRSGNAHQGSFSPFSPNGWSIGNTNANVGVVTTPTSSALNINGGDFTIECNVKLDNWNIQQQIIWEVDGASTHNPYLYIWNDNTLCMRSALTTGTIGTVVAANIVLGKWFHIAVCKVGNTVTMYKDGVALTSGLGTNLISENKLIKACKINGSISNFRVVKGTALYTGNFTPPVGELTAVTGTQLLIAQSNRFKDNSINNFALTTTAEISVKSGTYYDTDIAYSPLVHGGSVYFDGAGDAVASGAVPALAFGTGAFTIDCWIYPKARTAVGTFIGHNGAGTGALVLYVNNAGQIVASTWQYVLVITTNTVPLNAWSHIAVSCTGAGNTFKIFINGVLSATSTQPSDLVSGTITMGAMGGYFYTGYLAGARYIKGMALYTSDFSVPTSPPDKITNTCALMNFTNANITDVTAKNDIETIGNVSVSTGDLGICSSNLYFDGHLDYLGITNPDCIDFGGGDFTIEMRVWCASFANETIIYDSRVTSSGRSDTLAIRTTGAVGYYMGIFRIISQTILQLNTWAHIALTRTNGVIRLFVNGVVQETTYTNTASNVNTRGPYIGIDGPTPTSGNFSGRIEELQITKESKYTTSFTPTTLALSSN